MYSCILWCLFLVVSCVCISLCFEETAVDRPIKILRLSLPNHSALETGVAMYINMFNVHTARWLNIITVEYFQYNQYLPSWMPILFN